MAERAPRNIVLLSDGTGNSAAKLFRTNVWRLYEALDLADPRRQVAYYDNGVGTSSFKLFAALGGIFGFGLKRNVIDIYSFLCRHYQPGDRIYGFGFSRGAFTIRVLIGMVARYGVVPYRGNEAQLARDARDVYRLNRKRFNPTGGLVRWLRGVRDGLVRIKRAIERSPAFDPAKALPVETIHFVGVWDTVEAYGGPIQEITRAVDYYYWPLSMPDRLMSGKIQRACHAIALDDERHAFWPVLWDEDQVGGPPSGQRLRMDQIWREVRRPPAPSGTVIESWAPPAGPLPDIDRQRLSQVWFAGMHSSVGGGYPQDGLSYVTLDWMMDRADVYGLLIRPVERARLGQLANAHDKLNDSRHGLAGYYRYKPRKLVDIYAADPDQPKLARDLRRVREAFAPAAKGAPAPGPPAGPVIHESVFERIRAGTEGYSPIGLPGPYRVTTRGGAVTGGVYEQPAQAAARAHEQEHAWNWVWGRRVVYFLTLAASLFLAAFPLLARALPTRGRVSYAEIAIPLVDGIGSILPAFATPWLDAFKAAPEYLVAGGLLVTVLLAWGGRLQGRVFDTMRPLWIDVMTGGPRAVGPSRPIDSRLYRVRSSKLYRGVFYAWHAWVGPILFGLVILAFILYGLAIVSARVFFPGAMALGYVCTAGKNPSAQFDIRALCHATGSSVTKGRTYEVTLEIPAPWQDGHTPGKKGIETGPNGFGRDRASPVMAVGLPLRRVISEDWLQTIVRVGARGFDDQPVRFTPVEEPCACPQPEPTVYRGRFTARSTGDVFLYVNDAVYGLPWIADYFYSNNLGTAKVKIEPVP